ncbi:MULTISPECIES: hypothetical protein [unclassified Pseudofrankia]|uniref:hypothetical protein n=1 Tax=unclassified Pseudofrankia TaxID=2994372 RepID=UPI0008DA9666|nr:MULTISPECIES: hypothetical protein [unclassified Pseudofrankia]MDT3444233.1 hypothetical protein [Pseudofrankia sp. BMG5.37]OHV65208.1 hypothetical protein BCD48_03610 [Pseudofrankia sp. BMG5.36]
MDTALDAADQPRTQAALAGVQLLAAGYLGLSVVALLGALALRGHAPMVYAAAGGRVLSGVVVVILSQRAAHGIRRAFQRLRIVSAIVTVTVVPVLVMPGLPGWLKLEHAACGLLMLTVVRIVNGRRSGSAFATAVPDRADSARQPGRHRQPRQLRVHHESRRP